MKNIKYVTYEEIGTVMYRKNQRARNISIRISREGDVRVTVPGWCSYHKAEGFLFQKRDWIKQKLLSLKRNKERNLVWKAGDSIEIYQGKIELTAGNTDEYRIFQNGGSYRLNLPATFDPGNSLHQEKVFQEIKSIGLIAAREILPGILEDIANKHGFSFERLTVRQMKSRWGSCSATNRISLSSALIFLPYSLIEYVCLHELTHTVHKNHSRHFWAALEKELPDMLERRKALRKQTLMA